MSTCCFRKGKICLFPKCRVFIVSVHSERKLQQHLRCEQLEGLLKLQCQTFSYILTSCQLLTLNRVTYQKKKKIHLFLWFMCLWKKFTRDLSVSQSCSFAHTSGKMHSNHSVSSVSWCCSSSGLCTRVIKVVGMMENRIVCFCANHLLNKRMIHSVSALYDIRILYYAGTELILPCHISIIWDVL